MLEKETVGRMFVTSHKIPPSLQNNKSGEYISFLGMDVSHSGEALYIYKRLLQRPLPSNIATIIVDIGANDGILSSNSYNFIQMGWDAVLVEPMWRQLEMAFMNTARYNESKVNTRNISLLIILYFVYVADCFNYRKNLMKSHSGIFMM